MFAEKCNPNSTNMIKQWKQEPYEHRRKDTHLEKNPTAEISISSP